jgi:hypothetical protein
VHTLINEKQRCFGKVIIVTAKAPLIFQTINLLSKGLIGKAMALL